MPPTSSGCRGLTGVQFYSSRADVERMRQLEHESKVCVNNANLITLLCQKPREVKAHRAVKSSPEPKGLELRFYSDP